MPYKNYLQDNIFLEFSNSYKNKIISNISEASTQNSEISFSKRKSSLSYYYYTLKNLVHSNVSDIESIIDMYLSV
jgi:hypothetical protein